MHSSPAALRELFGSGHSVLFLPLSLRLSTQPSATEERKPQRVARRPVFEIENCMLVS